VLHGLDLCFPSVHKTQVEAAAEPRKVLIVSADHGVLVAENSTPAGGYDVCALIFNFGSTLFDFFLRGRTIHDN
jgi:hypothetical protein